MTLKACILNRECSYDISQSFSIGLSIFSRKTIIWLYHRTTTCSKIAITKMSLDYDYIEYMTNLIVKNQ